MRTMSYPHDIGDTDIYDGTAVHRGKMCGAIVSSLRLICTRHLGHDGPHVAHGPGDVVLRIEEYWTPEHFRVSEGL